MITETAPTAAALRQPEPDAGSLPATAPGPSASLPPIVSLPPTASQSATSFADLNLPEPLLRAVTDEGYELPTPIQAQAIPLLMQGRDIIGQAQTGTGKTAAFSLPLLQRIDPAVQAVQALVLVPTRELALQVATAVHTYAQHLPRIGVLPIFGGDSMLRQITRLERGVQVVVGTPGRILDHLRRGSLSLAQVGFVVLDEADEMLRMGFLEDVEAILAETPSERQTALLSATLPPEIRRVSRRHLREPQHVAVASENLTVATTEQRAAIVPESLKLEAVARLLETEEPEAALIFTRTRAGASELADRLSARGFPAEALHSDLSQAQRLQVLQRLRDRRTHTVVATDVAARGLDIDHISHVINYDLPGDPETYVHRIGRTGRAGRAGVALLLATPTQRPILRSLERFTQRPLGLLNLPTAEDVAVRRREQAKARLTAAAAEDLSGYRQVCSELVSAGGLDPLDVAAAALRLLSVERPLFADRVATDPLARVIATAGRQRDERTREAHSTPAPARSTDAPPRPRREEARPRAEADARPPRREEAWPRAEADAPSPRREAPRLFSADVARILVSVGHRHGVRPSDIVGAIANEAGLAGREIGHIEIHDGATLIEIPSGRVEQVLAAMRHATLRGQPARPRLLSDTGAEVERPSRPRPDARRREAPAPRPAAHRAAPPAPPRARPRAPERAPAGKWSWDAGTLPRGRGERLPKRRPH